jgi:organic radical activating enzyme
MSDIGGPYSPLKVFHHPERLAALRQGENIPPPVQIQAFISDFCQHDCGWCAFRWSGYTTNSLFVGDSPLASFGTNNPDRQIPFGKVIEILDDAKEIGVKAIQYTGGGEPTVHPNHREIFQATLDRGLDLALVSNGSIFRKADAVADSTVNLLLRAQWVRFSMDAGTRETYASTRRINPALFEQFQRNVSALTEARRGLATRPPLVVGIGFVVNKDNWREVVGSAPSFSPTTTPTSLASMPRRRHCVGRLNRSRRRRLRSSIASAIACRTCTRSTRITISAAINTSTR